MFARPLAKAKEAASSPNNRAHQLRTLLVRPLSPIGVDQTRSKDPGPTYSPAHAPEADRRSVLDVVPAPRDTQRRGADAASDSLHGTAPLWDFSKIPVFSSGSAQRLPAVTASLLPGPLQAKLYVGAVDDPLEHEANRVAEQVMRKSAARALTATRSPQAEAKPAGGPQANVSRLPGPGLLIQRKCACGGGCPRCQDEPENALPVQTKLRINEPGDQFEQEADRVAGHIFGAGLFAPVIQRTCACGGTCDACRGPGGVNEIRNSPGQPMDGTTCEFMESRFGYDFSKVRIYAGPEAADSARELDAQAYTAGDRIVFGANRYAPATDEGRRLLAHELTHVVQQSGAGAPAIQRKPVVASSLADPCANWSSRDLIKKLPPYNRNEDDFGSPGLHALSAVFTASLPVLERAQMLRVACCQLEPADATLVKESFAKRRGKAGQVFHALHPSTQRDLISILDDRASRGGKAEGTWVNRNIESEFSRQEGLRRQEKEDKQRQKREEEQWARDKELFDKAGRTTWFDVFFPSMAEVYRIPYAQRIQNPLLRFNARVAERGATVSIAGALADPITRPIKAVVKFFECLISAIKSGDVNALKGRFGLKFAATFTVSFGPGVIVGATREIGSIAKQIASIIAHPIKFVEDLGEFLKLLWSPNSDEIACAMGEDMGGMASKDIGELATLGDVELSYELGKIAGPFVLNTLLALVAPEVVGALKATRIGKRLLSLLEAMGSELKFLDKWRRRGKTAVKIEEDIVKAERVEKAVADAGKYIAEHKIGTVEEAADGLRHAPVGNEGHQIVEVLDKDVPTGIACELFSPGPHPRVPCPPKMGSRKETIEEFKARGGKVQEVEPGPVPKKTEAEKVAVGDPKPPTGFDDMPEFNPKTPKQVGVGLAEDHHVATKYRKENKAIFDRLKMSIDDDLNMIVDFEEHGQLRGWYDWNKRGYKKFYMKGHHPEYNAWVTKLLQEASPEGLAPDKALKRVEKVLQELKKLVRENPELLSHGPGISPKFKNLKIPFE